MVGLVAAAAFAVTGCGASDAVDSTAPELHPTVSKAQFLKKADAICGEGTAQIGRLDTAAWNKYDPDQQNVSEATENKVALAILPAREREVRRLRAVGLPKGSARYVDNMLTAWEEGAEVGEKNPRLLRAGGYEFAFYKAYTMGIDYGIKSCWLG
jgi:hypothetical protein